MKYVVLVLLSVGAAAAQLLPGRVVQFQLPAALVQHLELTAEQTATVNRVNTGLLTYEQGKQQRMITVQVELARETVRETVDAMALGLRYLELESIRREMAAERSKAAAAITAVFTPAQRAKLQSLNEALRLSNLACLALTYNLMTAPAVQQIVPIFTPAGSPDLSTVLPSLPANIACTNTASFRLGDFTGTPLIPAP